MNTASVTYRGKTYKHQQIWKLINRIVGGTTRRVSIHVYNQIERPFTAECLEPFGVYSKSSYRDGRTPFLALKRLVEEVIIPAEKGE